MLATFRYALLFLFVLLTKASALTLPISLPSTEAPDFLKTNNPSPQCAAINNGGLFCCTAAVSGGFPLVQATSALIGYTLPANTLNGYLCTSSTTITCSGTQLPLCCQVVLLMPVWGLWCQSATST
ncbi:hypothetical protein TWF718_006522 [Orbilia javanica]|uniref:Hydrophobin n=1 Tax=Orbilia javanica TaxID=47235 RepID=A0AAN8NA00_9PEZI